MYARHIQRIKNPDGKFFLTLSHCLSDMILLKPFLATNLDTLCEHIYYRIDAYKPQVVNKNFMGSRWWFIAIFDQKAPKRGLLGKNSGGLLEL